MMRKSTHALLGTVFLACSCACEPQASAVADPLRVNGAICSAGALPADLTGLTVGVPADRPLRVQDADGAPVGIDAVFAEGTDPAFSLLRQPFVADDATVVPLRIQVLSGTPQGTLVLTPDVGNTCEIVLTATTGA